MREIPERLETKYDLIDRHILNLNAFMVFSFLKRFPLHKKTWFSTSLSDLVNIVYNLNVQTTVNI